MYPIYPAWVLDATTLEPNEALKGQQIQVVTRNTTTPYPIYDAAEDPIPSSLVTVTQAASTPTVYIDTVTPETVYLDWYDAGSGARGPIWFEEVSRQSAAAAHAAAAELATGVVRTVNGVAPDENGAVEIDASGVDDTGLAELIQTPASATALALSSLYGPGALFLDLDDPAPPGTLDGTLLYRTAGGGTPPPVPVVYMADDFERTVAAGSIGTPSSGGSYSAIDIAADWSVGSGAGRWIAPAAGARAGYFRSSNYSQETLEVVGLISQETGAVGNRVVTVSPRRIVASATQYGLNMTLRGPSATRPLQVDVGLQKGATEGDMQSATAGVVTTGALGQKIRFKVQVIQEDPATTRVRARVWLDGTEEPATWVKDATDTTAGMQGPGSLAVLTRQNSGETVGSEVRIHEYTVQSIV